MSEIPRTMIEGELPGGRKFVVTELDGEGELRAAAAAGDATGTLASLRLALAQVFYSLSFLDGEAFDRSSSTPEALRDLMGAKDWQFLAEATMAVNRPTADEVTRFRDSLRTTTPS